MTVTYRAGTIEDSHSIFQVFIRTIMDYGAHECYGYVGSSSGPFAVLNENDFPAVLAHAENLMAEKAANFGVETPLINTKAIQYFVEHKYQIDSFSTIFMSNVLFGKFENYLCFSPEFFK